jgi:DNA-binding transcriptional ArsR family regulator
MVVRQVVSPEHGDLEPLLADPVRLFVVSLLSTTEWCRFGFVRETIGLSTSALSRHVAKLREAGYVETTMGIYGRTWVRLTQTGQERLMCHVTALHAIVSKAGDLVAQARRGTRNPEDYWSEADSSN